MSRILRAMFVTAVLAAASSWAWSSNPGEPLGECADWVFVEPGISCVDLVPAPCEDAAGRPHPLCLVGQLSAAEQNGWVFVWRRVSLDGTEACPDWGDDPCRSQLVLVHSDTLEEKEIGYVLDRSYGADGRDTLFRQLGLAFDEENGRLVVQLFPSCQGTECVFPEPTELVVRLDGFTTEFEIHQSYDPGADALTFRVPVEPEGLRRADFFDTYYGALSSVGDWAAAEPLECGFPSAAPVIGERVSVADLLPSPSAGEGYYYVTSVSYLGERRFGRASSGGVLRARDPSAWPGCP